MSEDKFRLALIEELSTAGTLSFASLQSRLSFLTATELQRILFKCENEGYVYAKPIYDTWDRKTHKVQVEFSLTYKGRQWLEQHEV